MGDGLVVEEAYRKQLADAADAIIGAFLWDQTDEGFEYWNAVHVRLTRLAEGRPM